MKAIIISIIAGSVLAIASSQKIEFEAPESYPEGIAYCTKNNTYYVSSARLGTIGSVSPEGNYKAFFQSPEIKSSYGLKIHPDQKRLFACIGDANYSKFTSPDTKKKMARVIAVELKSGKKVLDLDLSGLVPGHHFPNDLTFDKKGNAYITDSYANVIYKVSSDGKASVFAKSALFKTEGVGLNGIAWHSGNFLLVASSGTGSIFKVDVSNPTSIQRVELPQFLTNADGILLNTPEVLTVVQNGGSNRIYELESKDNWKSARIKSATALEDRFAFPSTATANGKDIWVINAKFNELNDSIAVPSKKFSIQRALFQPIP